MRAYNRHGSVHGKDSSSCLRIPAALWAAGLLTAGSIVVWSLAGSPFRSSQSLRGREAAAAEETDVADFLRSAPFNASRLSGCDHLVVVCGHAITVTESLAAVQSADVAWSLLPYQRGQDLPASFVAHVKAGVEETQRDPKALLVFSGGQSRPTAGPKSEGFSYWSVAEHFYWWGAAASVRPRAVVEDYARDSFENLLFAIGRFREVTGRYPARFTVIGYEFKRNRFTSLHAPALGIAAPAFRYMGLDPPPASRFDLAQAAHGEYENALRLFSEDPYGCRSEVLVRKRAERNPYQRTVPYRLSCPEIVRLLDWCGPDLFPGPLPWD